MSKLHEALDTLRPKDYSTDVPQDGLDSFLQTIFQKASLIVNSVPSPPGGTDFNASQPSGKPANAATKATEITVSPARPPALDPTIYKGLSEAWGKPLKLAARDNPLGITVHKMAAHDKYGAWFARRSVHEGLGFGKWKRAMEREFEESLAVQGGPGEGNIRGIGGDRRLEQIAVDGVGKLEVYQLSAQFPGPTAPREFITMLLSTVNGMEFETPSEEPAYKPRHYMLVSIPVTHGDAPPRQGLVRGQYESVELIREVQLNKPSLANGSSLADSSSTTSGDPETNPVEWIMITRSDPGGGIPRFMVERGTPSSIVADASKFLDWACKTEEFPPDDKVGNDLDANADATDDVKKAIVGGPDISEETREKESREEGLVSEPIQLEDSECLVTLPDRRHELPPQITRDKASSPHNSQKASPVGSITSSAASSTVSFASALENHRVPGRVPSIAYGYPRSASYRTRRESSSSEENNSLKPPPAFPPISRQPTPPPGLSENDKVHFEREMAKITARRSELQYQLSKARDAANERRRREMQSSSGGGGGASDTKSKDGGGGGGNLSGAGGSSTSLTASERDLRKQEDRYKKEMTKLDQRQEKETRRAEQRQRKATEKEARARGTRERDEVRRKVEVLGVENKLLKEQVGSLQRENTMLVAKLGKLEGGPAMLARLKEELARVATGPGSGGGGSGKNRSRAGSAAASERSKGSKGSRESLHI